MNDNDCISRAWLLAEYDRQHEGPAGKARKLIEDAPAVPQEMSAREYLAAEQRMCFDENVGKRNCLTCPLSSRINPARINCGDYTRDNPEEAVAIVEKWARKHPERSEKKTT